MHTPNQISEERFEAYQKYMEQLQRGIAPSLGERATKAFANSNFTTDATNIALTPFLGLVEATTPDTGEYAINPDNDHFETYANPLGEVALAPVVNLADRRPTPREAILAQAA